MKPVLIIPGLNGSVIVNRTIPYYTFLGKKILRNKYFEVNPLNNEQLIQWTKNINVDYNYGKNLITMRNEEVSVPLNGGTEFIKNIIPEFNTLDNIVNSITKRRVSPINKVLSYEYFNKTIYNLECLGYEQNKDIIAVPYDFRLVPSPDYLYKLFTSYKYKIEKAFFQNNSQKVVLLAHSLGALMTYVFLVSFVSQQWKDTFIDHFVSICAPYGGSVNSLMSISNGSYILEHMRAHVKVVSENNGGVITCLPNSNGYDKNVPLLIDNDLTITLDNMLKVLPKKTKTIYNNLVVPNVLNNLEKNNGVKTIFYIIEDRPTIETYNSHEDNSTYTMGDGIVTTRSANAFNEYKNYEKIILEKKSHRTAVEDPVILQSIK